MKGLTVRQLRGVFVAMEVNLLLWLSMCGQVWDSPSIDGHIKHFAIGATVFAALLQHWAYYNLFKKAAILDKEQKSEHKNGH